MTALRAEQVSVRRNGRDVLRDVSLSLTAGDCVAIVGPNGAGKTTLLQALIGLLPLTGGRVTLDDRDIRRLSRREIARRVAYLPQGVEGFASFTVRHVVSSGRFPHLKPLWPLSADDEAAVERAMAACGVADLADRPVGRLSGGERQKVWLAAALAQQSPLLLLDEPTTALDPHHKIELIRTLQREHAAGTTIALVSHDLDVVAALARRVVGLRDGRVVIDAPVDAFFAIDQLRDVFGCDFELLTTADGRPAAVLGV